MKLSAALSGPSPCAVCKSEEHGHIVFGVWTYACPLGVDISDLARLTTALDDDDAQALGRAGFSVGAVRLSGNEDAPAAAAPPTRAIDVIADSREISGDWDGPTPPGERY